MESREEKESQGKILWKIFLSTLYLSAFTFGGGYVIVTLMKKKFVDEYHWIGEDEMLDLVLARCDRSQRSHRGRVQAVGDSRSIGGNPRHDPAALCDYSGNICLLQCVPQ